MQREVGQLQARAAQQEREQRIQERSVEAMQRESFEQGASLVQLEERCRERERQIAGLKVRLLRAKIETVHELRDGME